MKIQMCTKCKKEFPATLEYFYSHKTNRSGLYSNCKKCHKDYNKKQKRTNKKHVQEYGKEYYFKNKKRINDRFKEWRLINKDKFKEYAKKYRQTHPECHKLYNGYRKEYGKIYKTDNRDKFVRWEQERRAKKKKLQTIYSINQWNECKIYFNNCCCYCGKERKLTIEHFVPVSKMGELTINNVLPVCGSCNSSKNNKDFLEWYPQFEHYNKKREQRILKYLNYKDGLQQLSMIF